MNAEKDCKQVKAKTQRRGGCWLTGQWLLGLKRENDGKRGDVGPINQTKMKVAPGAKGVNLNHCQCTRPPWRMHDENDTAAYIWWVCASKRVCTRTK